MDAYKQGVITADDIRKRQIVGTTGHEAERAQNIARKTEAEQANIDLTDLHPLQRKQAQVVAQGGIQQQTLANQMQDPDPAVSVPAQKAFFDRQEQLQAVAHWGTATPELEKKADVKPPDFQDWLARKVTEHSDANPNDPTGNAEYSNLLEDRGEKGEEYQAAVKSAKSQTVKLVPGTPAYKNELRARLSTALNQEEINRIQMQVFKEFNTARATSLGKSEGEAPERALKTSTEENATISKIAALDPIKELDKARPQYQQLLLGEQRVNSRTDEEWRANPQAARAMDLHLAFNYFKMLHPDTRVTESNFKELKHLSPVDLGGAEIADQINGVLRGAYLDPTGRRKVIEEAKSAYQGYINAAKPIIQGYRNQAVKSGMDPDAITHPWAHVFEEVPPTNPSLPLPSASPRTRPTVEQGKTAPVYKSLSEVPSNVQYFQTSEAKPRLMVNPNYRP
jgi:hypothetical protein